ncbi:hypothetical protein ACFW2Z_19675 [Streptomyces sp. NPDC058866]
MATQSPNKSASGTSPRPGPVAEQFAGAGRQLHGLVPVDGVDP